MMFTLKNYNLKKRSVAFHVLHVIHGVLDDGGVRSARGEYARVGRVDRNGRNGVRVPRIHPPLVFISQAGIFVAPARHSGSLRERT